MKMLRMMKSWPGSLLFKTPYTCNIKVTTRCNLKCGFCGLWSLPVKYELQLDNYRFIADLLTQLGLARIVITGGEPLLREDTPEIIRLFSKRGFSTTLLTNGTLLNEKVLNRCLDMGLNDIGISLDTLDPVLQDKNCNSSGVWNKIIDSINLAVNSMPRGIVEVLTTVTKDNLMEIPEIIKFVNDELKAWSVINPVNIPPTTHSILTAKSNENSPPYDRHIVNQTYDKIHSMKKNGYQILVSDRFLKESRQYLITGQFQWNCDAGERYFTIFPDGGLAPCSDQKAVANIMEMTPRRFRSKTYRNTVRNVQKSCGGCIFSCWREASYLFNDPSVWQERLRSVHRIFKG